MVAALNTQTRSKRSVSSSARKRVSGRRIRMFSSWEKGMLADLIHDEITRVQAQGWKNDDMVVSDLWKIYYKLEEVDA